MGCGVKIIGIWLGVTITVIISILAYYKVFKDEILDDDEIGVVVGISAFWPLTIPLAIMAAIGYGLYLLVVKLFEFLKGLYEQHKEECSQRED